MIVGKGKKKPCVDWLIDWSLSLAILFKLRSNVLWKLKYSSHKIFLHIYTKAWTLYLAPALQNELASLKKTNNQTNYIKKTAIKNIWR